MVQCFSLAAARFCDTRIQYSYFVSHTKHRKISICRRCRNFFFFTSFSGRRSTRKGEIYFSALNLHFGRVVLHRVLVRVEPSYSHWYRGGRYIARTYIILCVFGALCESCVCVFRRIVRMKNYLMAMLSLSIAVMFLRLSVWHCSWCALSCSLPHALSLSVSQSHKFSVP